jgi:hypothetical protein
MTLPTLHHNGDLSDLGCAAVALCIIAAIIMGVMA